MVYGVYNSETHTMQKRCRIAHNLVRAESRRIFDVDIRPADCLLKKTHHIQMPDKFHASVFCKFNPNFHMNPSFLLETDTGAKAFCTASLTLALTIRRNFLFQRLFPFAQ